MNKAKVRSSHTDNNKFSSLSKSIGTNLLEPILQDSQQLNRQKFKSHFQSRKVKNSSSMIHYQIQKTQNRKDLANKYKQSAQKQKVLLKNKLNQSLKQKKQTKILKKYHKYINYHVFFIKIKLQLLKKKVKSNKEERIKELIQLDGLINRNITLQIIIYIINSKYDVITLFYFCISQKIFNQIDFRLNSFNNTKKVLNNLFVIIQLSYLQYLILKLYIMKVYITEQSTKVGASEKGKEGFQKFNNQILNSETKQFQFLKHKCFTLTNTITYLKTQNQNLRKEKEKLLALNNQYVNNLNKYYEDRINSIQKVIFPVQILSEQSKIEPKLKEYLKKHISGFKKLEGDHQNLVQHCLTMQKQIKNFKIIVDECNRMKQDLISVNHHDVKQLAKQIEQVSQTNAFLRTENNRITFELEKLKQQHQKSLKHLDSTQKQYQNFQIEVGESKNMINRIHQQNKQKNSIYQKRIYELNVKCNALEQQLRLDVDQVNKAVELKQQHQIEAIQYTHKEAELKKTLSEFNKLLTSTGNSLCVDESYKQKMFNGSFANIEKQNVRKMKKRSSKSIVSATEPRRIL